MGLIRFGNKIYTIFIEVKFGTSVAWHVATRLMKILIFEISEPHHGVSMTLKAVDQLQISQVTLLDTLRSLDIMREIQRLNVENHSSVANKLVKFLAVNTEFQSIMDLQTTKSFIQNNLIAAKKI